MCSLSVWKIFNDFEYLLEVMEITAYDGISDKRRITRKEVQCFL